MSFRTRLAELVQSRASGSNADFGRLIGVSGETVRLWLDGAKNAKPSMESLEAIARTCEVSLDWLILGANQELLLRGSQGMVGGGQPDPQADELLPIQRLAFRAAAGDGALVIDEDAGVVPFSAAALRRIHLRPESARFMHAVGDSMRPTIEDGDPLVIDISDTEIIDGRVYVFSIGDQALVKRLRRRGARLLMRSDNRELFPDDEEVPTVEPVRIIGRVRWVGRSL